VLGKREVPIPENIDIFHLIREMPASEKNALQAVMEVDEERVRLEKLADTLVACEDDGKSKQFKSHRTFNFLKLTFTFYYIAVRNGRRF